ncbi:hypothetical protein [Streptomyces chryseus]|uniref:Uncharacterized protein n=1 Tax=Streptomyces chryseus TaxID=68186 RepID=A0ABQ3DKX0_9ACTN|nr:hypothetical protein [Streptomyces chryseus]GHA98211.1 hypothetical protein GCM10010346_21430 [Streptomyces chryseus]
MTCTRYSCALSAPARDPRYEEVPAPVPAEGQVRIDVRASGVHLIETLHRHSPASPSRGPPTRAALEARETECRVVLTIRCSISWQEQ